MRKLILLLFLGALFSSHDMFLKLDDFFLEPNSNASIQLYNGTFTLSENVIDRNRMLDVSLVGNGKRMAVDSSQWREREGVTILDFTTGSAGTWVAGVSTRPRNIEMEAADFNDYLVHDGVLDELERRKRDGTSDRDAVEKYAKHVKTVFQVGDQRSEDYGTALGYPIEFIPLSNPYDLEPGGTLRARLLRDGAPLSGQHVYLGSEPKGHDHGHDHDHEHGAEDHDHAAGTTQLTTDADGVIEATVDGPGKWYLRTIHMTASNEPGLTHESNWATLTFAVKESGPSHAGHDHAHGDHDHAHGEADHDHGDGTHTHADGTTHEHHHEEGDIPGYLYWLGSLLVVGGLFWYFNRSTK